MDIKNIGSLHPIDSDGYILNPCIYPVAQQEYAPVVDWILIHCRTSLGNSLHSIYLRGSVAKGQAIPFVSDVDTMLITHHTITEEEKHQVFGIQESVKEIFPFVTKVEIMTESLERAAITWLKFLLKTQCVCIYGTNLIPAIESFRAGPDAFIHSPHIVKQITELQQELESIDDPDEIESACVWIMKAIVRSGFELVMERDRSYTRDLFPNYERFSIYFPEKQAEMGRILNLAIEPTTNKKVIKEVLYAIKPFLWEKTKNLHSPLSGD